MASNGLKHGNTRSIVAAVLLTVTATAASQALAATIGTIKATGTFYGNEKQLTRQNAWKTTWSNAWDNCRRDYPATRSINMLDYSFGRPILKETYTPLTSWECRNTK
ncbi:hypothetical protein [Ralstonia solanacearum]|uniref:hypothetical protein n=1 Tax=Ralstonia solanacearum TaxID=305 RepID=UPI000A64987E|nr:hypothetical protein [Ralstonia solanacearum]MBB6588315.1 hypothetical protein [Ralstonia solanacearum]MCG3576645.1 hypothetical protein [Ralstonia solanacearum]MCL9824330.1 hypothetical protein [Ralstonia solanacearum]MCL9829548.1 hypothetical protein [Ralstonia solanacearum]MCL9834329.1 hypothetical protein [Ralstonia solanacearum]